jgi:hypothetical protein
MIPRIVFAFFDNKLKLINMKIIIQNLSLDFSLESENKISPSIEEKAIEASIKELQEIIANKEIENAELKAICEAPLAQDIQQAYMNEISDLRTELSDAKYQIEVLKSQINSVPSPVAEALEATAPPTKKQIICTCKVCGKTFPANHNRSQFCSEECRAASIKQKQSGKNVSASTTPVADALEATNKKTKTCTECAADFYPSSNRQMRCPACGIKKKSRKRNSELTRHPKK